MPAMTPSPDAHLPVNQSTIAVPRRRSLGLHGRPAAMGLAMLALGGLAAYALAQTTGSPATGAGPGADAANAVGGAGGGGGGGGVTLWALFKDSFDLFTVLLVVGSLMAWTVIIMCLIDIREVNILPPESEQMIRQLGQAGQWGQVKQFVSEDDAFVSKVVNASMNAAQAGGDKDSVHEAGELAASEEVGRWFRKIEPLNIVGNLGPLLGLAGTVWGMVIAFAALGQAGGQASPASLSLGISKALFHTLLGLLLAVPALTVFGFYRTKVDRLCNRAMVVSAELVELLPVGAEYRNAQQANMQPRPMPAPVGTARPR